MKKYSLTFLLAVTSVASALADVVIESPGPTRSPTLNYTLFVGLFAVILLLIVRRVRRRKQP